MGQHKHCFLIAKLQEGLLHLLPLLFLLLLFLLLLFLLLLFLLLLFLLLLFLLLLFLLLLFLLLLFLPPAYRVAVHGECGAAVPPQGEEWGGVWKLHEVGW